MSSDAWGEICLRSKATSTAQLSISSRIINLLCIHTSDTEQPWKLKNWRMWDNAIECHAHTANKRSPM